MSEETSASAPTSESAKPEPSSSPPAKSGRKLWPMIAAIVVVLLLVGVVVYVYVLAPEGTDLTATVSPDPCVVDAGAVKQVSVWPMDGNTNLSAAGSGATYLWSVSPSSLGSFELSAQRVVNFQAGNSAGTGTLTCRVKYNDEFFNATATLQVLAPYLDSVVVAPSEKTVPLGESQEFNATAYNSVGAEMTGVDFTWTIDGLDASEYTLNATTGFVVLFTSVGSTITDNVTLNATATVGGITKIGSATINLGGGEKREVVYRWYDMFNCPFSFAWKMRAQIYPDDIPITDSYPYIFQWYGEPAGNVYYYTMMKMNMTARNLPEISMNGNPWFIPLFGTTKGGNADLRWHLYYPDWDEVNSSYGDGVSGQYEGWLVVLKGTIALDRQAAMAVLGLTSAQFDDFATWWTNNGASMQSQWQTWITSQSRHPFDIYCAYELDINLLGFTLLGQKVGDKVVLTWDTISWGMEILLTRWLRYSFMGTEWYFDEMWLNATIGPESTDLNADSVANYAVYAYETSLIPAGSTKGIPNWMWEGLVQDYLPSKLGHPQLVGDHRSEYDPYKNFNYTNLAPGSPFYGDNMTYDYAPGVQNLSENETLIFEWPDGPQLFYVDAGGTVLELWENMTCDYAEPMPSDIGEVGLENTQIMFDQENRTLTYVGPADFWEWSKEQSAANHQGLEDEWDRLGILPYGMPTVEFRADIQGEPEIGSFNVEGITSPIVVDEVATVTVTARDKIGDIFTDYTGTVHFSTNGTVGSVDLPADYQFVAGDNGVHSFSINFNDVGYYSIIVSDVDTPEANGSQDNIRVIESPHIDHFVVTGPTSLAVGEAGTITVIAYDQNSLVFPTYDGTITFTTDAAGGTYTLPADYEYQASDNGVKTFSNGVQFDAAGSWTITVTDVFNMTATGTLGPIIVEVRSPEEHFQIYDMFVEPFDEWFTYRWGLYTQDYIIGNTTGHHTYLYDQTSSQTRGIIFAPYRWNTNAKNMSGVSVDHPEFMPVFGPTGLAGAEAKLDIYFNYLNWSWWNDYWVPTWSAYPQWPGVSGMGATMQKSTTDGYYVGVVYNVTLNRAAAETWLNMPQGDDPETWWAANNATYRTNWMNWILNEGKKRLDIQCAYDDTYYNVGTALNMKVLPNGDISLAIGHHSWGYECLMTRWLTEASIVSHEPYWHDFSLGAQYKTTYGDVAFDAVGMYNLHAVKANESTTGLDAAWVWEPIRIDYVASWGIHPSQFDPWVPLAYQCWNAGDVAYGLDVNYDATPGWLNLTAYQTLTIQLPLGEDVIGYVPEPAPPPEAVYEMAYNNNYSWYENHTIYGEMSLGFWITNPMGGGADLDSMYDDVTKTLFIEGPQVFDQARWPGGEIYHGAPWIEFNVTPPPKAMAAGTPPAAVDIVDGSSAEAVAAETMSLSIAAVMAIVLASVFVLVMPIRRREY